EIRRMYSVKIMGNRAKFGGALASVIEDVRHYRFTQGNEFTDNTAEIGGGAIWIGSNSFPNFTAISPDVLKIHNNKAIYGEKWASGIDNKWIIIDSLEPQKIQLVSLYKHFNNQTVYETQTSLFSNGKFSVSMELIDGYGQVISKYR